MNENQGYKEQELVWRTCIEQAWRMCIELAETHAHLFNEQEYPDNVDATSYRRGGQAGCKLVADAIRALQKVTESR